MSKDVARWLAEFQQLAGQAEAADADAVRKFGERSRADCDLFDALEQCLDTGEDQAAVGPICAQLFQFYKHGDQELRRFTLELVPRLIVTYLRAVHHCQWLTLTGEAEAESPQAEAARMRWYDLVETLVLGLYNLTVAEPPSPDRLGAIPGLGRASVYHAATARPGQRAWARLRQWPLRPVSRVHQENRQAVLAQLLAVYNDRLFLLSARSLRSCLAAVRRLCDLGGPGRQRLAVDQALLLQCIQSVYCIMFAKQGVPAGPGGTDGTLDQLAQQALLQLRARAQYELYSDVLLVANAILSPVGQAAGQSVRAPYGIAVSPQQPLDASVTKNAITNASFRIRHLPEDIAMATRQHRQPHRRHGNEDSSAGAKASRAAAVADVTIHVTEASDGDESPTLEAAKL